MSQASKELQVGYRIPTRKFKLTRENIAEFHYLLHKMETGEDRPGKNIHTDVDFARDRGLPDVIADGNQTTAEISRILTEFFGEGFLRGGNLFNKFIKPVYPGYELDIKLTITNREQVNGAVRYEMDVFCSKEDGTPVIVGTASAWVR